MATHSNVLAWKIPRAEELGRLAGCSPWGRNGIIVTLLHLAYVT